MSEITENTIVYQVIEDCNDIEVLEVLVQDIIVTSDESIDIITEQGDSVVVIEDNFQIVEVAVQGPPGPPGPIGEDLDVPYAKRIDFENNDTVIYKGEATVGSLTSASLWRISRITLNAEGDAVTEWADGVAGFTKIWDDHLTLSYS